MRLIDADVVYETIKMIKDPDVAIDVLDHIIATTPTAYDVDGVVRTLTIEKEKWEKGCEEVKALENTHGFDLEGLWRNLHGRAYSVSEAIEIVRRG